MFLDFELFYSRPRFNDADSNSPTPKLITSIDHDTSPGAVLPVLPSSTMTTGHLTPWAVAAGDTITRHVFLVEHELISRYHQTSLDTFSSSSTNWFPDVITRHVFLVEHELISWCHHSTRFPRQARTSKQSQRAFLKAWPWLTRGHLASPAMSIFYLVLVPRWLPPPSPTSSSSPS